MPRLRKSTGTTFLLVLRFNSNSWQTRLSITSKLDSIGFCVRFFIGISNESVGFRPRLVGKELGGNFLDRHFVFIRETVGHPKETLCHPAAGFNS
jgi:hypothetical protein